MAVVLAVLIGVLVACSVYLMLDRNALRFVFGLVLLSNAANLTIFLAGGLTPLSPPLIPEGQIAPVSTVANALPQALVLTAIVIGFGLLAFTLALVYRAYQDMGTIDSSAMRCAEPVTDEKEPAAVPEPDT